MIKIDLNSYAPLITKKELGKEIFNLLNGALDHNDIVDVDMGEIVSMTTFCAKQIFGRLYLKLGRDAYKQRVRLHNVSDDVYFIIRIGINNAVKESME